METEVHTRIIPKAIELTLNGNKPRLTSSCLSFFQKAIKIKQNNPTTGQGMSGRLSGIVF